MRQRTNRIHFSLIAGALAAAALGACKKSSEYASTSDTGAMKIDSAAGRTDTTAAMSLPSDSGTPKGKWADASVLGFVTVANNGEIVIGKLGERMATNPAVKSYAKLIVSDHQKLLADAKALATKVSATADTTVGDARDFANHANDELKDLSAKAKGADWDKDFINDMIDDHQKVLSQLQDAAQNSQNATVRSALEKASGVVQQHLTKAQDIQKNVLKD